MKKINFCFNIILIINLLLISCETGKNNFGEEIKINGQDIVSEVKSSYSITVFASGFTSTGGNVPMGMKMNEFAVRIKNYTDSTLNLNIGPFEMISENGKSYKGFFYNGPVGIFGNGMSINTGKLDGPSNVKVNVPPINEVELKNLHVISQKNAKPKEFIIEFGQRESNRIKIYYH